MMNFKNHINSDKRYYKSKIQINAIFILIKSSAKMFNSFIISGNLWQWAVWTKRKSHVHFLEQKKKKVEFQEQRRLPPYFKFEKSTAYLPLFHKRQKPSHNYFLLSIILRKQHQKQEKEQNRTPKKNKHITDILTRKFSERKRWCAR